MFRNKLKEVALEFIESASWLSKLSGTYHIGYLFPSLGIVDLLTSHLRSNFTPTKDDKKLLYQISAYLTEYVVQCWEECGLGVDVSFDENGGLLLIGGLDVKPLHLQSIFASMLSSLPKELALDRKHYVPVSVQGDYVCLFIQGFLRGAYFEKLKEVDDLFGEDLNAQIDKVIAKQYAMWHEVVSPEVTISHLPELYLACLSSRHFLASEVAPMLKEAKEFVKYFKTLNIDPAMAGRKLSKIFIGSPSEYLSLLGIVLLGGYSNNESSLEKCLPALKVRSYATPLIRSAFCYYREAIGEVADWIGSAGLEKTHIDMIELDLKLGFMPWLRLSTKYIAQNLGEDKALVEFVGYVKEGNFFSAQSTLEAILDQEPSKLELRIQRAFFHYVTKDLKLDMNIAKGF